MRSTGIGITILAGALMTSVGAYFDKLPTDLHRVKTDLLSELGIAIIVIGLFLLILECFKKDTK